MFNRLYRVPPKQLREDSLHHAPVCQHVTHAARNAQVIFQHHELTAWKSDEIRPHHSHVNIVRHLQPAHLSAELLAAVYDLAWHNAIRKDFSVVVDIFQEEIERGNPLDESLFD